MAACSAERSTWRSSGPRPSCGAAASAPAAIFSHLALQPTINRGTAAVLVAFRDSIVEDLSWDVDAHPFFFHYAVFFPAASVSHVLRVRPMHGQLYISHVSFCGIYAGTLQPYLHLTPSSAQYVHISMGTSDRPCQWLLKRMPR